MASEPQALKPLLVIPMTGVSKRFTDAGYDRPKFLLESEGQTVIDHVIDMFPGWDDVVFICNALHLDDPRLALAERLLARRPGAVIVRQEEAALGPGAAVLAAREHIDPDRAVVVNYCDFTCYWDADLLAERLAGGEVEGVIPCYSGYHPHMAHSTSYAYVKMAGGLVADIQEKQPWTDDPQSEYASSGTYAFASGRILLDALDAQVEQQLLLKGEYYLSLTYKPLLAAGGRVEVMPLQHFMQWGTPQDFEEYRDFSTGIEAWTAPRPGLVPGSGAARVVLASGAGQRFRDAGYALPKPALPLSGRPVLEHVLAATPGDATVVVSRDDLPSAAIVAGLADDFGARLVSLPGLSEGQAVSALRGLEAVPENVPVTVAACDAIALVGAPAFAEAVAAAGPDGVIPWVAWPYHAANRKPGQYGWVGGDRASGRIDRVWLKQQPEGDAGVMIGTFSFGSRDGAIRMIRALIEDDERVNGEFYLDSLVGRALRAGTPAVALRTESFTNLGTPAEYEAALYWQSCFHKWANHPYSLAADPMVAPTARRTLDHAFRAFDPRPLGADALGSDRVGAAGAGER